MATDLPDEAGELLDELADALYKGASALSSLAYKAQAPETKQALRDFLDDPASAVIELLLDILDEDEEPEPTPEPEVFTYTFDLKDTDGLFDIFFGPGLKNP